MVAGGGSGIGQGCARRLAELGYHVIVVGRNEPNLLETVNEIRRSGGSAEAFVSDVRDWDRLGELNALVAESGLDLLINSAGGQFFALAADMSANGWRAVVETNLNGAYFLSRQLFPSLCKRRGAVVHVVANIWQRVVAGAAHSSAARAGVVNLTRTLALEWAAHGIRLNAVSPGYTDTPAVRRYGQLSQMLKSVPLGRAATVDEVVDAILFMARSPYITGEVLTIDGGMQLVS